MQALKIAAVAMNGLLGRTEDNLRAIDQWASRAKDSGADLVLFPELVVHGHNDPNTWYAAEAVPAGAASITSACWPGPWTSTSAWASAKKSRISSTTPRC